MGIGNKTKLNQLMSSWADGQVHSTRWLKDRGYGSNLLQKYKAGKWVESIGSGAYKKYNDTIDWTSGVACAQQELNLPIHVGGKSALALLGKSQYLLLHKKSVTIIGNKKELLPSWLKNYEWDVSLQYQVKNLFTNDSFGEKHFGYTTQVVGKMALVLSAPERAFLEYIDELPKMYSYTEAFENLENLPSLRSKIIQHLLEHCTSVKVKRLFLHLADKIQHPWFKKIDHSKIELGTGKRLIFKDGRFDPKYQITVPKDSIYE